MPTIDSDTSKVMADAHVVEFTTVGKNGQLNTKPMGSAWFPDARQAVLTTPIAYPQKAINIRRSALVAVLYSDFTGSGHEGASPVLLQGTASVADMVVAPQDTPDYWRALFRKSHTPAEQFVDPDYRRTMDWYFWRLLIVVTPDDVRLGKPTDVGGLSEPFPPTDAPVIQQIRHAVARYPTVVFSTLDQQGRPFMARATVTDVQPNHCTIEPTQPFAGLAGQSSLLWHRHNGNFGEIADLLVTGTATPTGEHWTFTPERVPKRIDSSSTGQWASDARRKSEHYLERHHIPTPTVDWSALSSYAIEVESRSR